MIAYEVKMLIELQAKILRILVGILVALQITLVISTYIIANDKGYIQLPKIYLSVAFRQDPGRTIAGFILPITAIIIGLLGGQRLWYLHALLRNSKDSKLFVIAVIVLIGAVVGMIGVAAVSLDVSKLIHWIVASLLFGSSTILMVLLTILERRIRIAQPKWLFAMKVVISVVTCISLIMMGASKYFSYLVASIFELIAAALLVAYIIALVHNSSFPLITVAKVPRSPRPGGREFGDQL
jgi:hypothetical protein